MRVIRMKPASTEVDAACRDDEELLDAIIRDVGESQVPLGSLGTAKYDAQGFFLGELPLSTVARFCSARIHAIRVLRARAWMRRPGTSAQWTLN